MKNIDVFINYFLIFLVVLLIIFLIYKLMILNIKKKSKIYKEIKKLNSYYFFFDDIPKKIIIKEYKNSKKLVLKYDFLVNICSFINNNQDNLLITIKDI